MSESTMSRRRLLAGLMATPALPTAAALAGRDDDDPMPLLDDWLVSSGEGPGGSLLVEFELHGDNALEMRSWLERNVEAGEEVTAAPAAGPDELVDAAMAMGAMVDEQRRLTVEHDEVCDRSFRAKTEGDITAFEDGVYDPAGERFDAGEERLLGCMRRRGLGAVIVAGRLYIDEARTAEGRSSKYAMCLAVVDVDAITTLV